MTASENGIRDDLLACLAYQRASVLAIVGGLAEEAWHVPVVASGWTVAGLVEHLGGAERHWFQGVVAGADGDLPWDEGRPPYHPEMAFTCPRPSAAVLGYYREQCDRADEILARVGLEDAPVGQHDEPADESEDELWQEPTTVAQVILHVIEETAAHTGHLEIARELLDGKTGLGLR